MSLASEVLVWEESDRLFSQLRTNAGMEEVRSRLRARGLEPYVETIEGCFDPTRLRGGNAFRIRWRAGTARGDVLPALEGF